MASYITEQMKKALLGSIDQQGEEQMGLMGYIAAPGQYLRGGVSDALSWLPGGVPAHGFTGRKMWGDEVLQEHGMVNKPGLDATDVLGFGMDMVVDPLNLFMGAGLAKGGVKLAKMLPKLASSAKRAETLAQMKTALGAIPGALKRHAPGLGLGIGGMLGGGALMASNEEGSDWKDLLGMGMMTAPFLAPMAMAAGRRARPTAREVLQPEPAAPVSPVAPAAATLPLPESYADKMKAMLIEHGFAVRPTVTKAGGSTNVKFDIFRDTEKVGDAITSFTDGGMSLSWIGTKGKTGLMNPYFSSAAKFAAEHGIPVRMKDSSKTGITGAKFMQHFHGAVAKPKSKYEWSKKSVAEALAAEESLPKQFTRMRSIKDETGKWIEQTEPVDLLSSDELRDSISTWGTAGGTSKAKKHTQDVLVARGDVAAATPEERIAAATRVMQAFPAHHFWEQRAVKLQQARETLTQSPPVDVPASESAFRTGDEKYDVMRMPWDSPTGEFVPPAHLRKWSKKSVAEALAAEDAKAALQAAPVAGPHGVLPIAREEIDFLEQLGIRDATKWQEIKRLLGGADARTPEAQAVIQQFLPR